MISALAAAAVISIFAMALTINANVISFEGSRFRSDIELRALAEAGLYRIIAAYSRTADTLRSSLVADGRRVQWQFNGRAVELSAQAESGKLDLNAGDPLHIQELARRLISSEAVRDRFLLEFTAARRDRNHILSIASLIPPFARMTETRDILESHFTVYTGQRGFDPLTAPRSVVISIPEISHAEIERIIGAREALSTIPADSLPRSITQRFATERAIYTFRASAFSDKRTTAMQTLVSFSEGQKLKLHSWHQASTLR